MCVDAGILVVMPAYDEAATVRGVVAEVRETTGCDVLVVNDASDDATAGEARAAGAEVLDLSCRLGAWLATQAGLRYALERGYSTVVTCDADGQHVARDIPRLVRALAETGADVVIGCCTRRGSRARRLAWCLFRRLSHFSLSDLTSGYRAYNLRSMKLLASPMASLLDYQDLGVLLLLRSCGYGIVEVDVGMCARPEGKSRIFFSWFAVARYMLLTIMTILIKPGCRRGRKTHAEL